MTLPDIPEFEAQVDSWVRAAMADECRVFGQLLHDLPGVFPTEVLAAVRRLVAAGAIDSDVEARLVLESRRGPSPTRDHSWMLPPPHPLDFEWRFTDDASRVLLDLSKTLAGPNAPCLLLGTPNVALQAILARDPRPMSFVGESNAVTAALLNLAPGTGLTVSTCEQPIRICAFDTVIVDPPWYIDFIRPMLAAAAAALRPGGYVILSLPPRGTRPGIELDRQESLRIANTLGLSLFREEAGAVGYQTPYFEFNALRVVGIEAPVSWRHGDLFVLRKTAHLDVPMPTFGRPGPAWAEAMIGRMRIRVRGEASGLGGPARLLPLVNGDILPSVSRRDPRRSSANVWTSGNRVFACNDPAAILLAARHMSPLAGGGFESEWGTICAPQTAISDLVDQLGALASLEAREERSPYMPELGDEAWWKLSSTNSSADSTALVSGAIT